MISGIKSSRFFGNSAPLMVLMLFTLKCVLIVGLLFRFAVSANGGEFKALDFSTYNGVTLVLFGLFLFITRAHERNLIPRMVFLTNIAFVRWEYWLFYGAISFADVLNMFYPYADLTHRIQEIPPASIQVIVDRFIPGIIILVLLVFIFLMVDFWRCMTQGSHLQKLLAENGG